MAFLEKYSKSPTIEELRIEFEKFLKGPPVGHQFSAKLMKETTRSGMYVLRHLPCTRDSVFEFISTIYEEIVKQYMSQAVDLTNSEEIRHSDDEVALLEDIHGAFIIYLESCGQVWAPILSQWTLHLLGLLSSQFSSTAVFGHCQSVNEVIQIWMGCKAVQSLLDLTSRSLTCKDHANEDTFISTLLDTSATHSPKFDWVVAHVGNSYPQTIVSKVLELGLQHFSSTPPMISKLSSVAGILGHLVTTHAKEVQHAFHQTLEDALSGAQMSGRNTETFSIPYLLQLCSSSGALLDVLMDSTLPKIKGEALEKLVYLVPRWINLHFGGQDKAVMALVTHLILKSTRGPRALEILMSGCKSWSGCVGQKAKVLLDHFTAEISRLLYESDSVGRKDFPCISALKENHTILMRFLIDLDPQVSRTAREFVKLLALYDGPAIGVTAACHYLRFATEEKHLWHLADLLATLELKYETMLEDVLKNIAVKSELSSTQSQYHGSFSEEPLRIWKNILRLIKSEGMKPFPVRCKFSKVLQENLSVLTPILDVRKSTFSMEEASLIVEVISKLSNFSKKAKFGDLLTLERHLADYLFQVLLLVDSQSKKSVEVFHISQLLYALSENPAIQNDALRTLVQTALDPDNRSLFMEHVVWSKSSLSGFDVDNLCDNDEFQPERFSMYVPLMQENRKRTASVCLSRMHSTSLHSGRLTKSELRNWGVSPKVHIRRNPNAAMNLQLFITVLLNTCIANSNGNGDGGGGAKDNSKNAQASVESMRKIALLLVEIVSPDVMFNGLPWPEEEFSKVQVERDLQIRRAFEHHPYLWDLLELIANHCPSLCYCSVLLRALMATLMAYWTSSQEAKATNSPVQLEWSVRLINIMKTGQLLPPPLAYVGQILHELKANEVLYLLRDIWGYMKMNVPVPALFIKDPTTKVYSRNSDFYKVDPIFTEKLRLVLLNNVETLGHHYPKFFPGNVTPPPTTSNKNGNATAKTENGNVNSPSGSKVTH